MTFYVDIYLEKLFKKLKENLKFYRKKIEKTFKTVKKETEDALFRAQRSVRISIAKLKDTVRGHIKEIPTLIEDAFTVDSPQKMIKMAEVYGEELSSALYETQMRIEGLQNSIIRVAAPLAQAVVPIVNTAVKSLTTLANTVGKIVSAFMESTFGIRSYENSLKSAIRTTGSMERYLAGFDEIQRLGSNKSSGLTSALIPDVDQVIPGWEGVAKRISELLAPLKEIDFTPAIEGTRKALKALQPVLDGVAQSLDWAVENLLVPLTQWAVENVLPASLEVLTAAFETLGQILEEVRPVLTWLWENWFQKLAQWYGEKIISDIEAMGEKFRGMGQIVKENLPTIEAIIHRIDEILGLGKSLQTDAELWQQILAVLVPAISNMGDGMSSLSGPVGAAISILYAFLRALQQVSGGFDGVHENAVTMVEGIREILGTLWGFTQDVVLTPTETGTKTFLNKIIGYFEKSITGISSAYNQMFAGLGANFENMETVAPSIGSVARSLRQEKMVTPSIPRLARGAVLPANKPFMAVVGDQKHGTNIEAPLTTIQEAVANVMQEYMAANMAGHEATVAVLRELLEAVLGISIGDDVIANAVTRYNQKMAVVRGG